MLSDKIILITGGCGTIGSALVEHILMNYSPKIIRIYSRDETKQHLLSKQLNKYNKKLRFFIGDVRDKERLNRAMENVNIVFHLAALKHVIACEYNPFEAIKTNILGLQNLIEISIDKNVERVIFTSTDKAATPCNTMGVTKLLGEKLMTAANYYKGATKTIFYSIRLGNVLGSRGSLIPLIEQQIINKLPITLTHSDMTRYIIDSDSVLKIIIKSLALAQGGEVFVPKMVAVKIIDIIEVLIEFFAKKYNKVVEKIRIEEVGMFVGEKLYEELFSIEESKRTYEMDCFFIIIPQITEVSIKIDLSKYPHIKRFDENNPFDSKEEHLLSKNEIKIFLTENKVI